MAFAAAIAMLCNRSYCPVNHWALGQWKLIPKEETYTLRVRRSTNWAKAAYACKYRELLGFCWLWRSSVLGVISFYFRLIPSDSVLYTEYVRNG